VQGAMLLVGEIVAFVVRDRVNHFAIGQIGWLVELNAPVFDTHLKAAHKATKGNFWT
jgi:hypothetical protein